MPEGMGQFTYLSVLSHFEFSPLIQSVMYSSFYSFKRQFQYLWMPLVFLIWWLRKKLWVALPQSSVRLIVCLQLIPITSIFHRRYLDGKYINRWQELHGQKMEDLILVTCALTDKKATTQPQNSEW